MSHFEHPTHPVRHVPSITSAEVGAKVTCQCGWHTVAGSAPQAARAFIAHEKASEGGEE